MTTQTLSGVTLQSLENYRTAAAQAVVAYRIGGRRLVRVVDGALKSNVYPRTATLAPRATERMNDVRGSVAEAVVNGIDQIAERAERVIEAGSSSAAAQVAKLAKFTAGIDNEAVANGLRTVARLTMPGAKVALAVSSRVAAGASALADGAGARPVQRAIRKAASQSKRKVSPVARKAQATLKAGVKHAARVTKAARPR
jgi:hypothetical protein